MYRPAISITPSSPRKLSEKRIFHTPLAFSPLNVFSTTPLWPGATTGWSRAPPAFSCVHCVRPPWPWSSKITSIGHSWPKQPVSVNTSATLPLGLITSMFRSGSHVWPVSFTRTSTSVTGVPAGR